MTEPTRIGLADEPGLSGADGPVIASGPALSAEDAARQLVRDGWSPAAARALVRRYQDEASLRLGVPVHGWGLDAADLDAIRAGAAVPTPRTSPDEEMRRGQLSLWHAQSAHGEADELGAVREWS